jgi:hypothetical protein
MKRDSILPPEVIDKDRKLELASDKATERLAELRWHWTADETNPDRVTLTAYAKAIGRTQPAVTFMVNAYDEWISHNRDNSLIYYMERAKVGTDRAAVHEAVALARRVKPSTVRGASGRGAKYAKDVRAVIAEARELAEERGTSIAEEAPRIAQARVDLEARRAEMRANRSDRAARARARARNNTSVTGESTTAEPPRHMLGWLAAEAKIVGHLRKARQAVRDAIEDSQDVEFPDDIGEELYEDIARIRAGLDFLESAITSKQPADWDAALAAMTEGQ